MNPFTRWVKAPQDGRIRRWKFKIFNSSVSWPRQYGFHIGEDRFGGHGEHNAYPWTRLGLFLVCGHFTKFIGWELERTNEPT